MSNDVVLAVPGSVTETSLDLPTSMAFEDWQELGRKIGKVSRAAQFWLGDWMLFGESRYGERFAQAVEETGYEPHTLQNFMWVAKHVPPSSRRRELSFSHHAEVASIKDPERRDNLLTQAVDGDWSHRELRAAVREESPPEPQTPKSCGQCGETLEQVRLRLAA